MELPAQSQVLIVGAGPNGMACAITLARLGLQVTIVDALVQNRKDCRAVVVHAHTLEVLNSVGLSTPMIEAGVLTKGAVFYSGVGKLMEIDIGQLHGSTDFPFVLAIPQDQIEQILRERLSELGIKIFRPHQVVGLREAQPADGLDVIFDNGSIIRSKYVIGADGARSTIRRLANIDHKDPKTGIDYDGYVPSSSTYRIALADVYLEEPLPAVFPHDSLSFHFGSSPFLLCPLPPEKDHKEKNQSRWRIVLVVITGAPSPPPEPDINWLQKAFDERTSQDTKLRIASVITSSRYRARSAVADTFFKSIGSGNILLVGDAAHVHSPAGGQGLNLGLCDAIALGNTINSHIKTSSDRSSPELSDKILSDYSASRKKIALRVVGMAEGFTAIVNIRPGWRTVLRNVFLWVLGKTPIPRVMAWRISGLANRTD